jgi:hypothetical protein
MNTLSLPLVLAKALLEVGLGTVAAVSLSKGAARTTVRAESGGRQLPSSS